MFTRKLPLLLVLCTITVSAAFSQGYFPKFQEPWPKAAPEGLGMSTEILKKAESKMRVDDGSEFEKIDLIVLRGGKDVWHIGNPYEQYKGAHAQKDWASCGRSLMTTMFGMLFLEEETGLEVMEKPVKECFNSYIAWDMDPEIKVKHLLSYTACADPPGSSWQYHCHYFTMYKILRDVDGRAPDWRIEKLARQIGADWKAHNIWLHRQDVPFLSIATTPPEAARWGYLWLHKGNWDGTQVVDSSFVEYSVKPVESPLGGYAHSNEGLQIHLNYSGMWGDKIPHDAYAAFGAGGRIIFVCPSLDLVVASITSPGAYHKVEVDGETVRNIAGLIEPIVDAVVDK